MYYTVSSTAEAWTKANEIFPDSDYMHDSEMSSRAGYPVYWSTKEGSNAHVNDLCARLEVVMDNGECVNIWIEEDETQTDAETETATEATEAETLTPVTLTPAGCVDCSGCPIRCECIHADAYRRNPQSVGGLGKCPRLAVKAAEPAAPAEEVTEEAPQAVPAADAQSVSFRVEIERRNSRGETVKTVIDRMCSIEATANPADLLDWMQDLRQAWTKARKAITRGEWVTFQITRGQWYTAGHTAGHWQTVSFDAWEAVPPQEQGEEGIYFRADPRYTDPARDIYTENAATAAAEILRAM